MTASRFKTIGPSRKIIHCGGQFLSLPDLSRGFGHPKKGICNIIGPAMCVCNFSRGVYRAKWLRTVIAQSWFSAKSWREKFAEHTVALASVTRGLQISTCPLALDLFLLAVYTSRLSNYDPVGWLHGNTNVSRGSFEKPSLWRSNVILEDVLQAPLYTLRISTWLFCFAETCIVILSLFFRHT